jgi:hypothetical protein
MKELIEKIEQKEKELSTLREELSELGKSKYAYLIGKFFSLSATEMIKITGINYVDDTNVNIECLRMFGGKHGNGQIDFKINDDYYLYFVDIEEKRINEVSRERFVEFMYQSFEETTKVATEFL